MEDTLKQAKAKALRLLEDMDRTEEQLRIKLKQKGFTDDVIDKTLEYVKSYNYINDQNYAERFVLNKQGSKSRREIYSMLYQKGISRDEIEHAMETCYENDSEEEAIRRLCEKKHYSVEQSSDSEKQKMYAYLMRKGFRNENIRRVMKICE